MANNSFGLHLRSLNTNWGHYWSDSHFSFESVWALIGLWKPSLPSLPSMLSMLLIIEISIDFTQNYFNNFIGPQEKDETCLSGRLTARALSYWHWNRWNIEHRETLIPVQSNNINNINNKLWINKRKQYSKEKSSQQSLYWIRKLRKWLVMEDYEDYEDYEDSQQLWSVVSCDRFPTYRELSIKRWKAI